VNALNCALILLAPGEGNYLASKRGHGRLKIEIVKEVNYAKGKHPRSKTAMPTLYEP